jgi:hypothetical protein
MLAKRQLLRVESVNQKSWFKEAKNIQGANIGPQIGYPLEHFCAGTGSKASVKFEHYWHHLASLSMAASKPPYLDESRLTLISVLTVTYAVVIPTIIPSTLLNILSMYHQLLRHHSIIYI